MSFKKAAKLLATTSLLAASPVVAQQLDAPKRTNAKPAVDEIVVTATRSETTLQKTPMALNVYSGQDLLEQNVTTLQSLQAIDPSINITQAGTTPYVAIRGIQSTNTTEVGNPSVSIARDGFFTSRTLSLGMSFYDLDRIEVLKGPQGTLFGRSSTGGLVNIITAKPRIGEVSGYANAVVGNYSLFGGEGAVNVPIGDKIAVRLSGFGRSRDGYRKITGTNFVQRSEDDKSYSGRAQILVRPFENFDILVRYQKDHSGGVGPVEQAAPFGVIYNLDPNNFSGTVPSSADLDVERVTWVGNLSDLPGDGTLTYTGGTELFKADIVTDGTVPGGTTVNLTRSETIRTVNHELRYAAKPTDALSLQFGVYYFRERNDPLVAKVVLPFGAQTFNYDVVSTSKAIFGQASYNLTPEFKVTVGARKTWDSVTRTGSNTGFTGVTTVANAVPNKSDKFTYRFGLDWEVNPTSLIYAKFDTGYKPGGFSTDVANPNNSFGPETVQSFELGSKNRFLDNRLTVNANVFYQVLDGFQARLQSGATVNAGKTKTYGFEFSTSARVAELTKIDFSGTYLHGRFGDNVVPFLNGTDGTVDVSGKRLANAPSWVLVGAIEQGFDIGVGLVTARVDGKYSSPVQYANIGNPDTTGPAYAIGNASLRFESADKIWNFQIFVRNFTNEKVFARATRQRVGSAFLNTFMFQAPRTFGAQFGVRF